MNWWGVALGGAGGTLLRAMMLRWLGPMMGPYATLGINALGSLAIGLLWGYLLSRQHSSMLLWNALGVGLLGGFTTYSSHSLDVLRLLQAGKFSSALLYALGTLVLSLAACALGLWWTRST
nr:CrcB family protein [Oceanococcus sp. HetDA_MAG_MS8]